MSQFEQFAQGVRSGVDPFEAADELRGNLLPAGDDELSRGVRAVTSVLVAAGVPVDHAVERARNLAMCLADGVEDVHSATWDVLRLELMALQHRVVDHVAAAWLRGTGRDG